MDFATAWDSRRIISVLSAHVELMPIAFRVTLTVMQEKVSFATPNIICANVQLLVYSMTFASHVVASRVIAQQIIACLVRGLNVLKTKVAIVMIMVTIKRVI